MSNLQIFCLFVARFSWQQCMFHWSFSSALFVREIEHNNEYNDGKNGGHCKCRAARSGISLVSIVCSDDFAGALATSILDRIQPLVLRYDGTVSHWDTRRCWCFWYCPLGNSVDATEEDVLSVTRFIVVQCLWA